MANYIAKQKHINRQRMRGFLNYFFTVLITVTVVFCAVACAMLPTPHFWKTEDITVVDIQHRNKPRGFARYAPGGYELTDDNGHLYWLEGECTWPQKGESYTVTYAQKSIYRQIKAVSYNGEIIISRDNSIADWEHNSSFLLLILVCCCFVYVRLFIQLYKQLHHPEILACKKRISAHREKVKR